MSGIPDKETNTGITRRKLTKGLAIGATAGLAGCNTMGDGDGGDGGDDHDGTATNELGERVPTLTLGWFTDSGALSTAAQNALPPIRDSLNELGMDTEVQGVTVSEYVGQVYGDQRTAHLWLVMYTNDPRYFDPNFLTRYYAADYAGGNGKGNLANWANCDYTSPAINQQYAPSEEERQAQVTEAHKIMSQEAPILPITGMPLVSAGRSDLVEFKKTGSTGLKHFNPLAQIKSEPKEGDTIVWTQGNDIFDLTNPLLSASTPTVRSWLYLIHSPLLMPDENGELMPVLAESYEVENEAQRFVFKLRGDATFHNGDPVTAEDVKFSFHHFTETGAKGGAYPLVTELPWAGGGTDSGGIEIVDDQTVAFNFEQSFLQFLATQLGAFGIIHKDSWIEYGAEEDPTSAEIDPVIGSGPFQIADGFSTGDTFMELNPYDEHPVFQPSHNIGFMRTTEQQSAVRALRNGELHAMAEVSSDVAADIRGDFGEESVFSFAGFCPFFASPQCSHPPMTETVLRKAVGTAMNRQRIIDVAWSGEVEPDFTATTLAPQHPYRPPDDELEQLTDAPTGDMEGAKAMLEDAGWGWDGNDNLHYPPGADVSPPWPKGETPSANDFPCLEDH